MKRPVSEPPTSSGEPTDRSVAEDPPFSFRRMMLVDLDEVMRIEDTAFSHPWSAELFRRELSHDWSTILLAHEAMPSGGQQLLGFVIYWVVHDEIHVLNVATDPPQRRRGVARALLIEVLRRGRMGGAVLATLEVRRSNQAALALYQRLGFQPVGVRPNYYADEGEDAIIMNCDLRSQPAS